MRTDTQKKARTSRVECDEQYLDVSWPTSLDNTDTEQPEVEVEDLKNL